MSDSTKIRGIQIDDGEVMSFDAESSLAVRYDAQELTTFEKATARENIGAVSREDHDYLENDFLGHLADAVHHVTAEERAAWNDKSVPTNVSELENDSDYQTSGDVQTAIRALGIPGTAKLVQMSRSGTTVTLDQSLMGLYEIFNSPYQSYFILPASQYDVYVFALGEVDMSTSKAKMYSIRDGVLYELTLSAANALASPLSGTLTSKTLAELPEVGTADNGKFLRVVSGVWKAQSVPSAESEAY